MNHYFEQSLKRKMETKSEEILVVSPEMAALMLKYNIGNRPPKQRQIKQFAEQMASGTWKLTREYIQFSDEFRLMNGQHRLFACIASGAHVQFRVAYGEEDSNRNVIDMGIVRSPGDVFSMAGVKHYNQMAAMTKTILQYQTGKMTLGSSFFVSKDYLLDFYQATPGIEESSWVIAAFKKTPGLAQPALMGALHFLCRQENEQKADKFFETLASGESLPAESPIFTLRARLIANKMNRNAKLGWVAIAAMTIKAWNAYRKGSPIKKMYWRSQDAGEKFPEII